jgi:hypothetical protein
MEGRGDATMKATRSSWQTKEMPEERSLLEFKQHFSQAQFDQLSLGKVPECMEDKWFMFFEEHRCLFFHRSWTGDCIFQLPLQSNEDGYIVAEAWVNRNSNNSIAAGLQARFNCYLS